MLNNTGSKRKIIEIIKLNGAIGASSLAGELGISAMAVRQHLYALQDEGLVTAKSSPDGVGRPAKKWRLTEAANDFFPQGYAELTAGLLSSMHEAFGNDGVDKIVSIRTRDQQQTYLAQMDGVELLSKRLNRLAEIRTEEGYMAEVRKDGGGYLFIENHCPICAAAKACTGLCAAELMLFNAVLGNDVKVERTEHILLGARRCAYRICHIDKQHKTSAANTNGPYY